MCLVTYENMRGIFCLLRYVTLVLFEGLDSGPDDRESVFLCPGSELRAGLLVHMPGRNHAPLDLPLLHGC